MSALNKKIIPILLKLCCKHLKLKKAIWTYTMKNLPPLCLLPRITPLSPSHQITHQTDGSIAPIFSPYSFSLFSANIFLLLEIYHKLPFLFTQLGGEEGRNQEPGWPLFAQSRYDWIVTCQLTLIGCLI